MKQLLSLLVCLGLVIGMSCVIGCGDDKKPSTTPPKADAKKDDKKDNK